MTMLSIAFVGWIVIGVVAGTIARPRHPGPESPWWTGTILLGIGGSLLGGVAVYILGYDISPTQAGGWIMSIFGTVVLLSVGAFDGRARSTALEGVRKVTWFRQRPADAP